MTQMKHEIEDGGRNRIIDALEDDTPSLYPQNARTGVEDHPLLEVQHVDGHPLQADAVTDQDLHDHHLGADMQPHALDHPNADLARLPTLLPLDLESPYPRKTNHM